MLLSEPSEFLQKFCRDIVAHNQTAKNHLVYDDVVEITKFDIKYPAGRNSIIFEDNRPEISILDPSSTSKAVNETGGSIDFDFRITTSDGSEFRFPTERTRKNALNNPESHDFAADMQKGLIANKSKTKINMTSDIAFSYYKKQNR